MKEHLYRFALGAIAIVAFSAVCITVCGLFWLVIHYPTPGVIILTVFLAWFVGTLIRGRNEAN